MLYIPKLYINTIKVLSKYFTTLNLEDYKFIGVSLEPYKRITVDMTNTQRLLDEMVQITSLRLLTKYRFATAIVNRKCTQFKKRH